MTSFALPIIRSSPAARTVALTFDSFRRLVVSKELDHPRLLLDTDTTHVDDGGNGRRDEPAAMAQSAGVSDRGAAGGVTPASLRRQTSGTCERGRACRRRT